MLKKFKEHIKNILPLKHNIIVGVSGGVDSIVLCELLRKTKINFSVAHLNYKLRNPDSDLDEIFLKSYCLKNKINFYSMVYDLSIKKNSVQEKAREIRYNYFNSLSLKNKFTHIFTAHHIDDNIETLLINVYRGKKTNVFTGIKEINNNILRPLLIFTKEQILKFANENKLKWREDKTNIKNVYLRNRIRNILIPKLEAVDPHYKINFINLIGESKKQSEKINKYLKSIENEYFEYLQKDIIKSKKDKWNGLDLKSVEFILFRKYGFFKNSEILKILKASSGKIISSKTHEILSDRDSILIKKISNNIFKTYNINMGINTDPFSITIEKSMTSSEPSKKKIFIKSNVEMPLRLRKFNPGDFFYPYRMNGKKKVSKFFKDEKLSIFDKQKKWILTDANNQILWIIGMRVDKRLIKTNGECLKISV